MIAFDLQKMYSISVVSQEKDSSASVCVLGSSGNRALIRLRAEPMAMPLIAALEVMDCFDINIAQVLNP